MASFVIKKATRELIYVKLALMAPSGGGKTYGSLRVATGMKKALEKIGQETRILLANTENARGRYYANEFDYDIIDVTSPHNPENYVDLIDFAVESGYKILIIDSTSHEWEGKGGCLELHQLAGGTYQSWSKVTPRHDKFIAKIADSPIHIIATMRGKDQYEMEKGESGKTTVKKLGVGAKQREGFEYEFTATFLIDQKTNMAIAQKDNTHLFENEGEVKLSESHGEKLIEWANSGEGYSIPVRHSTRAETESVDLKAVKAEIIETVKELGGSKNEALMEVLKSFEPSGNPNKIKDEEILKSLKEKLQEMKKGE